MKRTVTALLMLCAFGAYADQKPMPEGRGDMMPPMPPHGGMQMRQEMKEPVSLTQDEAKAKFAEFISANLKGYEIKDINSVYMPFGTMHQATVTDKSGNRFYLNITPDGNVMGPMLIKN